MSSGGNEDLSSNNNSLEQPVDNSMMNASMEEDQSWWDIVADFFSFGEDEDAQQALEQAQVNDQESQSPAVEGPPEQQVPDILQAAEQELGQAQAAQGDTDSESAAKEAPKPTDVVLYMTLNNTTHKQDEIPESMAALKQAEAEGLGHRELLPISDPYATKDKDGDLEFSDDTYGHTFGEDAASRVEWWHGNEDLESGQVSIDGEVQQLGSSGVGDDEAKQDACKTGWKNTVMELGMDEGSANKVIDALFKNDDGTFRALDSGDGATNELAQFVMVMWRAEKGEINVKSIVFSGHHWRDENYEGHGQGIWGEVPGEDHVYDDTNDYFSLVDVAALKAAFPNAYGQIQSVQLAACNTDDLGMKDEDGEALSTNEFLQDCFENLKMTSYWKQVLAPLAASGAETNGEFILDSMRLENGDEAAAKDARHNTKGLKRSLLDESGELDEIIMKTKSSSYGGARKEGLRGENKDFDEREDLADYVAEMVSHPDQTPEPKNN